MKKLRKVEMEFLETTFLEKIKYVLFGIRPENEFELTTATKSDSEYNMDDIVQMLTSESEESEIS